MCPQAWYYSQTNSTYKAPVSFPILNELQSDIIRTYNTPVVADIFPSNSDYTKKEMKNSASHGHLSGSLLPLG